MRRFAVAPPAIVAMLLAAGLVVLGAGWLIVVGPQRTAASTAAKQVDRTKALIDQAQLAIVESKAAKAAAPEKQPVIHTADLYRIAKAMPASADQPDLLLELDQVARAAGVTVLSVAPGSPTAGAGFATIPIALTLSGDFYGLTDLLYRLRGLVSVRNGALDATGRLFSVSALSLTPVGEGKALSATLTVNAYVYGTAGLPASTTTTATTQSSSTSSTSTTSTSTTATTGATTTGSSG